MINSNLTIKRSLKKKTTGNIQHSNTVNKVHVLAQGSAQGEPSSQWVGRNLTCYVTERTFGIQEGELDVHKYS